MRAAKLVPKSKLEASEDTEMAPWVGEVSAPFLKPQLKPQNLPDPKLLTAEDLLEEEPSTLVSTSPDWEVHPVKSTDELDALAYRHAIEKNHLYIETVSFL